MRLGFATRSSRLKLTRLALTGAVALALLGAAGVGAAAPNPTAAPKQAAGMVPATAPPVVAILLAPFLTHRDLSPDTTPRLWSLAEKGALGSMNAVTADPGWPSVTGGALTFSAGRWASAGEGVPADAASIAAQQKANDGSLAVPVLGALGDAVHAAAGRTAAVGSSDSGGATGRDVQRPAELVATDSLGRVDILDTGDGLLAADAAAPQGTRTDAKRLSEAISSAIDGLMSAAGPRLLVVDSGDLTRTHDRAGSSEAAPQDAARDHEIALSTLDAAAGDLMRDLPAGSLLLVVAPATDKPYYEPPHLAPVIAWGGDLTGALTSSSTHRPGLVTNLDVAPTVLAALGIQQPATMVGRPLTATVSSLPLAERTATLARTDAGVGSLDKLRDLYFTPVLVWFTIVVALFAGLVAMLSLTRLRLIADALLLLVLSVPSAAWLTVLLAPLPTSTTVATAAFALSLPLVFAAACAVWWRRRVSLDAPMLLLSALTVLLICADQWLGNPASSGLFSYSIRAGWRYYGIGNEGSALAVAAALAALGLSIDLLGDGRPAAWLRRWGAPVLGAVVLLTAAAPFAGANAGVAVWGIVAFGVAWLRVNDIRFTVRNIVGIAAVIVVLVGALVAVDLLGARGMETHIGRFFTSMGSGGGAWELVRRKLANNVGYIRYTPYTWLVLVLGGVLALLRFAPSRPLEPALAEHPAYRAALLGVVVGGIAALLTEDSGVVMPALMLLAGGLPALALALPARPAGAPRGRRDTRARDAVAPGRGETPSRG